MKMQQQLDLSKRTSYAVAAEFVPKEGDNFRYHVAYAGVSDKYGQAGFGKRHCEIQSNYRWF